ncbi:unnamed protein product [Rhizophagus irregularis]|nr:unnamed protein product [Rhizophagus irregularis]
MSRISINIRLVIFLFSIFIAFLYSIFTASLCMTVLFVICRDWFLFCEFNSVDEEFKRDFESIDKREFESIDDESKRLIEAIEDELKPLKIKLIYFPIEMFNQIKMMIFLNFYIPIYLKREPSTGITREMRMKEFKSFLYYVTNIEIVFEKIFYSCFIFIKIVLTSSYATIVLFISILGSNQLFLSFLEIGALEIFLFSYILLFFYMEFYDFPIKFIFIHGGTVKEGLVIDCNECLESLTNVFANNEDDNDENKCATEFIKEIEKHDSFRIGLLDELMEYHSINSDRDGHDHKIYDITELLKNIDSSHIGNHRQGGFSTVYSAIWNDGPLIYNEKEYKYERKYNEEVALKCLDNSQNISDKFLNEIKKYSTKTRAHQGNILEMFGISQDPNTKNYIMVLKYAEDFGLCGDINDMNEKHMYGVIPYMAPEVGMRPEIEDWEAPKEYIDIMKSCWDSNPDNRPIAFLIALDTNTEYHERRRAFFKDFDEGYYKENIFKNFKSNQSTTTPKSQLLTFADDLDDLDTVIDDDQKNSV